MQETALRSRAKGAALLELATTAAKRVTSHEIVPIKREETKLKKMNKLRRSKLKRSKRK